MLLEINKSFSGRRSELRRSNVHFSSKTVEWATPWPLFRDLDAEFAFTLDPCSTDANAKCPRHFTIAEDGLSKDWSNDVVFMNPPYGREIALWMQKAFLSTKAGAAVVCLVPARTDTAWWHDFAMHGEVRFLRGRLKFGEAKHSAFPERNRNFSPGDWGSACRGSRSRSKSLAA
jgi:phage N-6-adenine-methyltransferase